MSTWLTGCRDWIATRTPPPVRVGTATPRARSETVLRILAPLCAFLLATLAHVGAGLAAVGLAQGSASASGDAPRRGASTRDTFMSVRLRRREPRAGQWRRDDPTSLPDA